MDGAILTELAREFPVVSYGGEIKLRDDQKRVHTFHVLEAYNIEILVDENGHFWMNEAAIGRALQISRKTLNNALMRFTNSQKGKRLSRVYRLETRDTAGRMQLMNFYNEATVAAVIIRTNDDVSEEALDFIEDREKIISAMRTVIHRVYLNAQLEQKQTQIDSIKREKGIIALAQQIKEIVAKKDAQIATLIDEVKSLEGKFMTATLETMSETHRANMLQDIVWELVGDQVMFPMGYSDDEDMPQE